MRSPSPRYDHEQVVEVVRDTPGQLAHRVHLLRLPELVLALPQRLVRPLELGQVHGEPAELPGSAGGGGHHVHDVPQPHHVAVAPEGAILELVILAAGEGGPAGRHHLGPVLGMDARAEEIRLGEPPLGREAEHGLGALAHEREAQGGRVRFPHDGVETLHQILKRFLRLLRAACRRSSSDRSSTMRRRRASSCSSMRMLVMVTRTGRVS
jgi:hypothetical protein